MIYLVTENPSLKIKTDLYRVISIEESLEKLNKLSIIGVDTETEGIDVHTKKLLLTQLGCFDFQVVIDNRTVPIENYKSFLEDSTKQWLFWNAKFDLKFFMKHGIIIDNIYDGFLAEKLLYLGFPEGTHSMSLKSAGYTYCDVELDKSVRGKIIWSKTLTPDVIEYGAHDVKYLEKIKEGQEEKLAEKGLTVAIKWENKFCPVLAYTEFCGVKLDENKWRAKMQKDQTRFENALNSLNSWVCENLPNSKYVYRELQGDLWTGFDDSPKCAINWSSPKQVIPLLQELGFNLETFDKKTKEKKLSVGAEIIESQKDKSKIAPYYLEYKAAEKVVGTYGENVLKQINPKTGRIHTNFSQLGCDTGRLSSGGKDKENNVEYLNFQNFPADVETRACFVSEPKNNWISCDYSGQESRIISDVANDSSMLELFNNGCGDIHSLVAKMSYPEMIGDCPIEEIKHKYKHWRQEAKGVEFAINYGGSAQTIATNKNIPLVEAQEIYDSYMKGFPGVANYQMRQRKFVMSHGYILLNSKTGHKAFIYNWDEIETIKKRQKLDGYWETYRQYKKDRPDAPIIDEVRSFFRQKSNFEKHAINYPIQATGALMFKLASIYLWNYLKSNDLVFKVKLCIPCHDEWNIEVPKEITEQMTKVLQDCMEKAGTYFCKKIKMPADAEVSDHWIH